MKLALTNYLSTAEETEAASEEVLDAFTDCLMKLRCMRINAFTLHNFKCMNNFIRLMLKHMLKNAILLNMTKPPVGGGKCMF